MSDAREHGVVGRVRPRCLAFALIAASACGTAEPVTEQVPVPRSDEVPVTETVPASVPVEASGTESDTSTDTNADTTVETDADASSDSASHALASVEPDVVLAVRDLGRGRARHDFEVPVACPLARVELDLEVESMPDGLVTLRTPTGREARLDLHVLTTTHFVRTWDWAMLDDLHAARGEPSQGTWTLEVRARGAMYQGGAQPHSSPMPEPIYPSAELRVYCEPEHAPAAPGSELRVEVEVSTAPRRPGAGVHALVPVREACVVDTLAMTLEGRAISTIGAPIRVVSPEGRVLRVREARPLRVGPFHLEAEVRGAAGLASEGVWELGVPRGSGGIALDAASLVIRCADSP